MGAVLRLGRVYNLLEPEAAAELGRRKGANLIATSPDVIAAASPGGDIQIVQHLERPIAVLHPMQLLARSLRGER
jgi:glycolate oxidase iron-sulfur subunit